MDNSVLERLKIGWHDSVCEANEKRVREYDRQAEEAMEYAFSGYNAAWSARGQPSANELVENRRKYEKGFVTEEGKTQLAVSINVEKSLRQLLDEARNDVVNTLFLLSGMPQPGLAGDIEKSSTWVPDFAHIPEKDLHVTVCIPSLWREPAADPASHEAYNSSVAEALRTAAQDHDPFVLEIDRIMLGKDGSLLAVFRTVGLPESGPEDHQGLPLAMLSDRGSEASDPMSSLRSDVLYVFLKNGLANCQRKEHVDLEDVNGSQKLLRQATIVKTVGGSVHGYIHCSLSRLAISPDVTHRAVDVKVLQRVCRSWTAKLAGRRMAVTGFKLTEMTGLGQGGNKNPFDNAKWSRDIELGKGAQARRKSSTLMGLLGGICSK
eukprot:TRINITY_DN33822_c0_g1_i1.p1 TRINITY_DN33822_c0_g1~~TRINITY_DN33822_c0_g1_i1.p1  ORF type:complete len:378 (+),score=74.84 TRINITY_DN33822_c0_g1_i1:64-1197(+)